MAEKGANLLARPCGNVKGASPWEFFHVVSINEPKIKPSPSMNALNRANLPASAMGWTKLEVRGSFFPVGC